MIHRRSKPKPDQADRSDDDDPPTEEEEEEDASSAPSSSEDEDEDEDSDAASDLEEAAAAAPPKAPPAKRARKTRVRTGRSPGPKRRGGNAAGGRRKGAPAAAHTSAARRAAHGALAALARQVLPAGEKPGLASLVAGLLHAYRPASAAADAEDGDGAATRTPPGLGDVPALSEYTPNLVALARRVVRVHNENPNRAQLALLNLLFRSVGGSRATDLSLGPGAGGGGGGARGQGRGRGRGATGVSESEEEEVEEDGGSSAGTDDEHQEEEVQLAALDTEDWARVVTDLVDDLRHAPAHQVPLCADPLGAAHQAHEAAEREKREREGGEPYDVYAYDDDSQEGHRANKKHVSAAAVEYRKIYAEFWYVLGHVALTDGGLATAAAAASEFSPAHADDASSAVPDPDAPVPVRLDAELVRGLLLRVIELSPVGQPDVRAAASLAALSLAHAVLDRSALLARKVEVARRQYEAAGRGKKGNKSGGGGAKAEALRIRLESLKRTAEDLEEVVLGPVVQGLFVHRYRDSDPHVRTLCLEALSRFTLQRPDLFLTDKYLKYFGWMTHDKDPRVRRAALGGLLAPFRAAARRAAAGNAGAAPRPAPADACLLLERLDPAKMEHVVSKFLGRIADAVADPSGPVQETAMRIMLALLKGGFLDDVSEDGLWDRTNQRCLAPGAVSDAACTKNAPPRLLAAMGADDALVNYFNCCRLDTAGCRSEGRPLLHPGPARGL